MLHSVDIDDDFFTPPSGTSLANIFGKQHGEESTKSETLKYTPPKSSQVINPGDQRSTECLFACAVPAYEWSEGNYISRGHLGFAILKILKTGCYSLILYDSNKATVSKATISESFEISIKEKVYFSYLDDSHKYWSVYVSQDKFKNMKDLLQSCNVKFKDPLELGKPSDQIKVDDDIPAPSEHKQESDTDSFVNKKTKSSILNRMATMGHSVLPHRTLAAEKSSDSSDSNESSHYKNARHKNTKTLAKPNVPDKLISDNQSLVETKNVIFPEHPPDNLPIFTYVKGQLLPITKSNIIASPSPTPNSDINLLMTEQRISNSELRMNVGRLSDKLDLVLGKITTLESKNNNSYSNIQIDILQKLVFEYENKIKVYEDIIKINKLDSNIHLTNVSQNVSKPDSENDIILRNKISVLEKQCHEKDIKIKSSSMELSDLQSLHEQARNNEKINAENMLKEIQRLNEIVANKSREHGETKSGNKISTEDESQIESKIKMLMNDMYHVIVKNFDSDKQYTGKDVESVVAAVIKKLTIQSLSK